MCKFDAEIKSYKDGKTIWIYHNHYLQQQTLPLCVQLLLLWSCRHISVAVDMRTLLDRKNFSSITNGQVAARRVTGLIIKRLWCNTAGGRVVTYSEPRAESLKDMTEHVHSTSRSMPDSWLVWDYNHTAHTAHTSLRVIRLRRDTVKQ